MAQSAGAENMRGAGKVHVPPIKTQGIKTKLVPWIARYVPADAETVWIEPFMGSSVVGFNLAPRRALFSDTNIHIIDFYRSIQGGELTASGCRKFLESEGARLKSRGGDYFYEVRDRFNESHDPYDFLFLNRSCFNGLMRFNRQHRYNVPYGHKDDRFSKAYITKIVNQLEYVQRKIADNDWEFAAMGFEDAIAAARTTRSSTATHPISDSPAPTTTLGTKRRRRSCTIRSWIAATSSWSHLGAATTTGAMGQ